MEDETIETQEAGGMDIVSVIVYEKHKKLCQQYVEKCVETYMSFWRYLLHDKPNLGKMHIIGTKIDWISEQVEEHWNRTQLLNAHNAYMLRFYGTFLIEVMYDEQHGKLLIEKAA